MRGLYSSKAKIRHQIFTEIARLAYEGDIEKEMAGLATYTAGVSALNSNSAALTSGTQQLADGAKTLGSGACGR